MPEGGEAKGVGWEMDQECGTWAREEPSGIQLSGGSHILPIWIYR